MRFPGEFPDKTHEETARAADITCSAKAADICAAFTTQPLTFPLPTLDMSGEGVARVANWFT